VTGETFRQRMIRLGVEVCPPPKFEPVAKANEGIEAQRSIDALIRAGWIVLDGDNDSLMHPEKCPDRWVTLRAAERIENDLRESDILDGST
jgi:hypothetical protein